MNRSVLILFISAAISLASGPGIIRASEGFPGQTTKHNPDNIGLVTELCQGFEYDLRILTYGIFQDMADTTQNPYNDFLELPRYEGVLDFRPDFRLNFRPLDLSLKPRMSFFYRSYMDGTRQGQEEWENDYFINEWLARIRISSGLFLSYGRENLQWGPSYLFSPSNPFFPDNGRSNPRKEVPGMDFVRLVWLPGIEWTISLIANTDKGEQQFKVREFEKSYALKFDYNGQEGYAGFILNQNEKDYKWIGAFAGRTVTDALLLYSDLGFHRGSGILYPVEDITSPFGVSMQLVDKGSSSWQGAILVGGAFTFLAGPTLTIEYLYNGSGYNSAEAGRYNRLKTSVANAYNSPLAGLSRLTLSQTVDPGLRFLRQNYTVIQYRHNDIRDVLNLTFSWIYNLDDYSGRFSAIVDWYVGDHSQIFTVGSVNHGNRNTEFRTMLDCYLMIGWEYTF